MLFTFPSRYSFAIGLSVVFSLSGWSPIIQPEFLVFRPTQVPDFHSTPGFAYGTFTLYGLSFQNSLATFSYEIRRALLPRKGLIPSRFGLLRFRSPLLAQSLLLSFPPGNEMFQFPGFAPSLFGRMTASLPPGCPIRRSAAVTGMCPLPRLIAACHVLLRFREPRHPSCALVSFRFFFFCRLLAAGARILF